MGPELHQFFSFSNISTNMVARCIQSFGKNVPLLAGWLSNGQNFFVKFTKTSDAQRLKVSRRIFQYLLKKGILKFFKWAVSPPSQCFLLGIVFEKNNLKIHLDKTHFIRCKNANLDLI